MQNVFAREISRSVNAFNTERKAGKLQKQILKYFRVTRQENRTRSTHLV